MNTKFTKDLNEVEQLQKDIMEIEREIKGSFIPQYVGSYQMCIAKELTLKGYKKQKEGHIIESERGCVLNCSECGERIELYYPDGTEIRLLPYCPYCGAKWRS